MQYSLFKMLIQFARPTIGQLRYAQRQLISQLKKAPDRNVLVPFNLRGGGSRDRTGDLLNAI